MESPNSTRLVRAQERRIRAVEMRIEGRPVKEIAEELGMSLDGAYKCLHKAMANLALKEATGAEELRALNNARLEQLLAAVWPRAVSGDDSAVDRARGLIADMRKLWGLDAPAKVQAQIAHVGDTAVVGSEDRLQSLSEEELLQLRELSAKVAAEPEPLEAEFEEVDDDESDR